jgi:hypothetical protein
LGVCGRKYQEAGKKLHNQEIGSFVIHTLQHSVLVYLFREGEMGRTYGMYGVEYKCIQYFTGEGGRQEATWKT